MNSENFRKLASVLRANKPGTRQAVIYRQSVWFREGSCGTAACLAGHAALTAGYKLREMLPLEDCAMAVMEVGEDKPIPEAAAEWLGMSEVDPAEHWLFSPDPGGDDGPPWPGEFSSRWADAICGFSKESHNDIAADLLEAIADGKVSL